jgi:hypothetical protein
VDNNIKMDLMRSELQGWELGGNDLGSCLMAGSGISSIEHIGSAIRVLVNDSYHIFIRPEIWG